MHYRDPQNGLHFLDSEAFEHPLPSGCLQISDEEAAEIQKPTEAEAKAAIESTLISAIQSHLDDTARRRGYDGILSLCS